MEYRIVSVKSVTNVNTGLDYQWEIGKMLTRRSLLKFLIAGPAINWVLGGEGKDIYKPPDFSPDGYPDTKDTPRIILVQQMHRNEAWPRGNFILLSNDDSWSNLGDRFFATPVVWKPLGIIFDKTHTYRHYDLPMVQRIREKHNEHVNPNYAWGVELILWYNNQLITWPCFNKTSRKMALEIEGGGLGITHQFQSVSCTIMGTRTFYAPIISPKYHKRLITELDDLPLPDYDDMLYD